MSPTEDLSDYKLSVSQVAEVLNVRSMTVRRWIQDGRLPARRLPGTKPYKLRQADVDALVSGSPVVPGPTPTATPESTGMAGIDSAQLLIDGQGADEL